VTEVRPETRLWDRMRGSLAAKALGVSADLRVAELLADGPRPVAELAAASGADAATLHRILRALASDGVFAEDEPGVFRNTDASELLRGDSWREFAHLFGTVFLDAATTLDPRTTEPTFPRKFGADFWSWLEANPAERVAFDAAMAGDKRDQAGRLAGLGWRAGETVVDVGGGNGALLRALLELQPQVRGIILDLPETDRDEAALGDRISFVVGDFFESVPAGDAYVLSGILHDWDDERAGAILRKIGAAAPEHARLLLLEGVVRPGNDPQGSKWLDLLMLAIGGRERTEEDWRALLEGAGFVPQVIEDGLIQATCR
jgi:O-methyltransferase domain/IclR helix-turn-helix domain